ncbi:MAG: hypothetical protein LLG00_13595 [Planctomycetaceae bacterium]|nr:hypothetical protein [Planctomycetaceae bacterium]
MANGTCYQCGTYYNKTYHLKQTAAGSCTWQCAFRDYCGDFGSQISLRVYKTGNNYHVEVTLKDHVWDRDFGTDQPTCTSLTGLIDHVTNSGTCSSANATCSISSQAAAGNCACESCGSCTDGKAPGRFMVQISGVTNAGACTGCSLFNGTWILTPNPQTLCCWQSANETGNLGCAGFTNPGVTLCLANGFIKVTLAASTDQTRVMPGSFSAAFTGTLDCLTLSFSGPWTLAQSPSDGWCNLSGATCTLTAL